MKGVSVSFLTEPNNRLIHDRGVQFCTQEKWKRSDTTCNRCYSSGLTNIFSKIHTTVLLKISGSQNKLSYHVLLLYLTEKTHKKETKSSI